MESGVLARLTRGASVHQKIRLLPLVAALALLLILFLTVTFGFTNERRLSRIEREDYPALRLTDSLQYILVRTQRRLEDVRVMHDTAQLARTDALRDVFLSTVAAADSAHVPDRRELLRLRDAFARAYQAGHAAAAASVGGDTAAARLAADDADEKFRVARDGLAARAASQRQQVADSFSRARLLQRAAWLLTALV